MEVLGQHTDANAHGHVSPSAKKRPSTRAENVLSQRPDADLHLHGCPTQGRTYHTARGLALVHAMLRTCEQLSGRFEKNADMYELFPGRQVPHLLGRHAERHNGLLSGLQTTSSQRLPQKQQPSWHMQRPDVQNLVHAVAPRRKRTNALCREKVPQSSIDAVPTLPESSMREPCANHSNGQVPQR